MHWQRGAKQRPLRLIVIAPTPYRKSKSKSCTTAIRLTCGPTDLRSSLKQLLHVYFDRWQIRGQSPRRTTRWASAKLSCGMPSPIPKQPVLAVAAYSALLLASLQAFGAEREEAYALPKWRRNARRPSCLDLITLLHKEMAQQPQLLAPFGFQITHQALVHAAAA